MEGSRSVSRRLERSRANRVIAGVCGGLGEYLDIDATFVRVAMVVLAFVIGIGVLALLANYGLVTGLSALAILALWPVLLILLGIDIAFARRWPVETLAAEVVIIGLALLLAATQPNALTLTAFNFGGSSGC